MKLVIHILLLFAVLSAFVPLRDLCEIKHKNSFENSCCSRNEPEETSHKTCTFLCQCSYDPSYSYVPAIGLSLEVKFLYYHSNSGRFAEEQTEQVFRPPIA